MNKLDFWKLQFLVVGLVVVSFWGCVKDETLPIEKDKLVIALRDVHVAESAILHLDVEGKDSMLQVYYGQICEMHKIERPDLDSSIAILKRNPELAVGIYERVYEELEKLNLKSE